MKGGKPQEVRGKVLGLLPQQQSKIETVVVTHPDSDHYNMLPYVLKDVDVEKVFAVGAPDEHAGATRKAHRTEQYPTMSEWMQSHATILKRLGPADVNPDAATTEICDCGDARIDLLAAGTEDVGADSPKNTRSIVVMVSYGKFDAILSGDATFDTENAMIEALSEPEHGLDCELLKVGHHGSVKTSCGPDWVEATTPEVSIVSAALNNTFGHPGDKVMTRLKRPAVTVPTHKVRQWNEDKEPKDQNSTQALYLTATNGSINVVTNGDVYDVTYEK